MSTTDTPTPSDTTIATRPGSTLGALALVCAGLGFMGCAVIGLISSVLSPDALWGLPASAVLSMAGFVLGVIAFFAAKKGMPRGAAIGATFLGAIGGAIQGAMVIGAVIQFVPIRTQVVPRVEAMLSAYASDDEAAALALLGPGAQSDAQGGTVLALIGRIVDEGGPIVRVRFDLSTLKQSDRVMQDYNIRPDLDPSTIIIPKPVELLTDAGASILLCVWLDEDALKNDEVRFDDMLVFLPSGTMLALRDTGPAWFLAGNFNAPVELP